eukprot:1147977-Pelagomonas_calceolata.AAC.1
MLIGLKERVNAKTRDEMVSGVGTTVDASAHKGACMLCEEATWLVLLYTCISASSQRLWVQKRQEDHKKQRKEKYELYVITQMKCLAHCTCHRHLGHCFVVLTAYWQCGALQQYIIALAASVSRT